MDNILNTEEYIEFLNEITTEADIKEVALVDKLEILEKVVADEEVTEDTDAGEEGPIQDHIEGVFTERNGGITDIVAELRDSNITVDDLIEAIHYPSFDSKYEAFIEDIPYLETTEVVQENSNAKIPATERNTEVIEEEVADTDVIVVEGMPESNIPEELVEETAEVVPDEILDNPSEQVDDKQVNAKEDNPNKDKNNGHGNGDQDAPGSSGTNNNAENGLDDNIPLDGLEEATKGNNGKSNEVHGKPLKLDEVTDETKESPEIDFSNLPEDSEHKEKTNNGKPDTHSGKDNSVEHGNDGDLHGGNLEIEQIIYDM